MSARLRLDPVQVGAPPGAGRLSHWVMTPVHFNGFGDLPITANVPVWSPEFSCFGHRWSVAIYPGGDSVVSIGYVTLALENRTADTIEVEFETIVKHPNGGEDISQSCGRVMKFSTAGTAGDRVFGGVGSTRPTLLNYLVDGTLILEVHMRTNKPGQQSASFVPENPFLRNAMMDLGDEETADVKIEVGGAVQNGAGRRKRGKTSTTFHAHHLVLRRNAPALADMCQPGNSSAPITINNVRPEIVKHLLFYCYGGKVDKEAVKCEGHHRGGRSF